MKEAVFKGACTALVSPFTEAGIDYETFAANLDEQYETGVSAVLVCGTTGECATLTQNEREELIRFTVRHVSGRMKVIAGAGVNNTEQSLRNAESARAAGADAVLAVTPYYNKTTQAGLIKHYEYIADRAGIPLILYNVPTRTGMSISAETYEVLAKHPMINGVKEASGSISLCAAIRSRCGDELNVWSGNDDNTVAMMALGACGVISTASNIVPAAMAKICSLCLEGDYPSAARLQMRYQGLLEALFCETNPIPVKAAMKLMGKDSGILRLPLTEISDAHLEKLKKELKNVNVVMQVSSEERA